MNCDLVLPPTRPLVQVHYSFWVFLWDPLSQILYPLLFKLAQMLGRTVRFKRNFL